MKVTVFNYKAIRNQQDATVLDVFIDGDILDASTQEFYKNYFGDDTSVSFKSFRDELLNTDAQRVNITVNSGGGMMSDAFAMHDFIQQNIEAGKDWHTYGIGMVASAATYPLLAPASAGHPDNMHISDNCHVMIHNASGGTYGTVDEVESYAKTMRTFNNTARDMYANVFSKPAETISAWMNAETWWNGATMKKLGLIKDTAPAVDAIKNAIPKEKWLFQNTTILNTINNSIQPPKEKGMKKNKIANAINEAFAKFFTNGVTTATAKPDDLKTAIIDALSTQDDDDIATDITNALSGEGFQKIVDAAVNKRLETIPTNITEAITNATKDVATKAELEKLTNDVAEKLGTPGNRITKGGEPENMSPEEKIANANGWNR